MVVVEAAEVAVATGAVVVGASWLLLRPAEVAAAKIIFRVQPLGLFDDNTIMFKR